MTQTQKKIENKPEDTKDLIKNQEPIADNNPDYEQLFKDLQGGVIKNYGRQYSLYIFSQFDENKIEEVKKWIRDEIANNVTSTWKQLKDTETYRKKKPQDFSYSGELCQNFFLSHNGYLALGFNLAANPNNEEQKLNDSLFVKGMKKYWMDTYHLEGDRNEYWYNPPSKWDFSGNEEKQVDALIFVAHDDLSKLKKEAETIIDRWKKLGLGKIIAFESGYVLRNENNKTVGPFGFADGISQPLFLKSDCDNYCQNQDIDQWNPFASLDLVLVKDPFGELYSYGSYCVFQKLEINYELFEQKIGELAAKLEGDRDRAGALVFGRFKDGTPIALSEQRNQNDEKAIANNFNYAGDRQGSKCPLHAHIRQVNPRHDDEDKAEERRTKNRIFRAGTTYFDAKEKQIKDSSIWQQCSKQLDYFYKVNKQSLEKNIVSISGLLFVCFQKSISEQFSRLQREWADDSEFPREREEGERKYLDPVIGHRFNRNRQKQEPDPQEWQKQENKERSSRYLFDGCIQEKGGEFFFMPSINFLKSL